MISVIVIAQLHTSQINYKLCVFVPSSHDDFFGTSLEFIKYKSKKIDCCIILFTFQLNNFLVIVGALLIDKTICFDNFDVIDIHEKDIFTEDGCVLTPLISRRGYSYM